MGTIVIDAVQGGISLRELDWCEDRALATAVAKDEQNYLLIIIIIIFTTRY